MSTPTPPNPVQLSHIDLLAIVANQARIVSDISEAVMRGRPNVDASHLVAATNRLSDLVAQWVAYVTTAPKSDKAA